MAGIFAFRCRCCGEAHEGSPSFGFDAPLYYAQLPEEERRTKATLSADFCTILQDDQANYFVRVVLEVPIHGASDPFLWDVWVSLSEQNFARYRATSADPDESDCYFGWLCNRLPYYPDTLRLRTNVRPRKGHLRAFLELHRDDQDHPLVHDLYHGLSIAKAQEIAEQIMHDG